MPDALSLNSVVELLGALERDELFLAYQPFFDVDGGRYLGVEALLRWRHPERGVLAPGHFLPEPLRGGLAKAITEFVITEAVAQCAQWARAGQDIAVSVNVPPAAMLDDHIPIHALQQLAIHEVDPDRLTVEITEQTCPDELLRLRSACIELSRRGVRLSLDDFGRGDSSLTRLQQLQFDELKIDRAFVTNASSDPTDRHIVNNTTQLAHDLGIRVVAEGVETAEACGLMIELELDLLQGYYFHAPTTPEAIVAIFNEDGPDLSAVTVGVEHLPLP